MAPVSSCHESRGGPHNAPGCLRRVDLRPSQHAVSSSRLRKRRGRPEQRRRWRPVPARIRKARRRRSGAGPGVRVSQRAPGSSGRRRPEAADAAGHRPYGVLRSDTSGGRGGLKRSPNSARGRRAFGRAGSRAEGGLVPDGRLRARSDMRADPAAAARVLRVARSPGSWVRRPAGPGCRAVRPALARIGPARGRLAGRQRQPGGRGRAKLCRPACSSCSLRPGLAASADGARLEGCFDCKAAVADAVARAKPVLGPVEAVRRARVAKNAPAKPAVVPSTKPAERRAALRAG